MWRCYSLESLSGFWASDDEDGATWIDSQSHRFILLGALLGGVVPELLGFAVFARSWLWIAILGCALCDCFGPLPG